MKPEINGGRFPAKRAIGEKLVVQADIFVDGHDSISARLLYRCPQDKGWKDMPMRFVGNDRWEGEFVVTELGVYHYTLEGWVDHFRSWQNDIRKKFGAGQDLAVDILIGLQYMEEALERFPGKVNKDCQKLCSLVKEKAGEDMEAAISLVLGEEVSAYMDKYPERRGVVRYERDLTVDVDVAKALFNSWYEFFPKQCMNLAMN